MVKWLEDTQREGDKPAEIRMNLAENQIQVGELNRNEADMEILCDHVKPSVVEQAADFLMGVAEPNVSTILNRVAVHFL